MNISYQVRKLEHDADHNDFIKVTLHMVGYPTLKTHPTSWEFELLVPREEIDGWAISSFVRLSIEGNKT